MLGDKKNDRGFGGGTGDRGSGAVWAGRRRRAYLDDFQKTASGEWIYTGKTYSWKADRKKTLLLLWLLGGVALAAGILAGCLPHVRLAYRAWTLLPYVVGLIASVTVIWAAGRLSFAGDPVRAYIFKATVKQFRPRATIAAVCLGGTAVAECVNLFLPAYSGDLLMELILIVLEALGCVVTVLLLRLVRTLEWKENGPTSI